MGASKTLLKLSFSVLLKAGTSFRLVDSTERTYLFQKVLQNSLLYSVIITIITFRCTLAYKSLAVLLVVFNGNLISLTVKETFTIAAKGNEENEPFRSLKTLNPPNICFVLVLFWGWVEFTLIPGLAAELSCLGDCTRDLEINQDPNPSLSISVPLRSKWFFSMKRQKAIPLK